MQAITNDNELRDALVQEAWAALPRQPPAAEKPDGPGKFEVTLQVEVGRLDHKPEVLTASARLSPMFALNWYPGETVAGEWRRKE